MEKQIIKTDKAPAAIGTYSQAIKLKADMLTFVSGKFTDLASGELIGTLVTRLIRLLSIFEPLKNPARMFNCVKINAYLTDLGRTS